MNILKALPLFCLLLLGFQEAPDRKLQKRVDASIKAGSRFLVKYLKSRILEFRSGNGYRAICLYALAHTDPEKHRTFIQKEVDALLDWRQAMDKHTYEASILSMAVAMDSRKPERFTKAMTRLFKALLGGMNDLGGWGYSLWRPSVLKGNGASDNLSSSQFAVFGVHAQHRFFTPTSGKTGVSPVPAEAWEKMAAYWLESQMKSGGWPYYHPKIWPDKPESRSATVNMTCAGISSLAIVRVHVTDKETRVKIDNALKNARDWLGDNYEPFEFPKHRNKEFGYTLYSLEKACDLAGWKTIGKRNWYREGAAFLIRNQQRNGSWTFRARGDKAEDAERNLATETAFALLFLKRASTRILATDAPGAWKDGRATPTK